MSLYHALFGENPFAHLLLELLGTTADKVPRYRDCFLSEDGTEIVIHTRTGGGNRKHYQAENAELEVLPGFKGDEDDDFDCTYANFRYEIPLRRFPWCNRKDAQTEINATCPDYQQRADKIAVTS